YILVIVNKLSEIKHFILTKGLIIKELIEKFINYIYTFYSLLNTVILNRGI
ncbi:hypothetical protein QR685DRAFT_431798, partial [Neurospora intermedia]